MLPYFITELFLFKILFFFHFLSQRWNFVSIFFLGLAPSTWCCFVDIYVSFLLGNTVFTFFLVHSHCIVDFGFLAWQCLGSASLGSLWKQTFDDFNAIYESWKRNNDSSIGSFLCVLSLNIQQQSSLNNNRGNKTKTREKKIFCHSAYVSMFTECRLFLFYHFLLLYRFAHKVIFSTLKMFILYFFSSFFLLLRIHFRILFYFFICCDEMSTIITWRYANFNETTKKT